MLAYMYVCVCLCVCGIACACVCFGAGAQEGNIDEVEGEEMDREVPELDDENPYQMTAFNLSEVCGSAILPVLW